MINTEITMICPGFNRILEVYSLSKYLISPDVPEGRLILLSLAMIIKNNGEFKKVLVKSAL